MSPGDDATATLLPVAGPRAERPSQLSSLGSRTGHSLTQGSTTSRASYAWSEVGSPAEALAEEERIRIRNYGAFCAALIVSTLATLPLLDGHPGAKRLHAIGLALSALGVGYVLSRVLRRRGDPAHASTALGHVTLPALLTGFVYWGDQSPATCIVPFAMVFFGLSQSFWGACSVWLWCAIPHAALSMGITLGLVEDRALIQMMQAGVLERLAILGLAQLIFAAAFVLTRQLRRTTMLSMDALRTASRDAAVREAQLAEANEQLQQVAHVGGPGRHTDQIVGSYRLGVLIGRGAMGEIYEGQRVGSNEAAAVKLLNQFASSPEHMRRFAREAEISSSLQSDHVVRVLDLPRDSAVVPFLVMERLNGETLSELLRSRERLSVSEALELVQHAAAGLTAAHAAGIIHRDLKPANLFWHEGQDGSRLWKILDFGVSKLIDGTGTMTAGHIIGTPGYMPPEQAQGRAVDTRADVYALGTVAYRALTGRPAFTGPDPAAIIYTVVHSMPPRPSTMASLPSALDQILMVALAKEKTQRYATAGELADAFAAAAAGTVPDALAARAARLERHHPWASRETRRGRRSD